MIIRKQVCCNFSLWFRPSQNLFRGHAKCFSSASHSTAESRFNESSGSLYDIENRIRFLCEKFSPQLDDALLLFNQAVDIHGLPSESTCNFLLRTLSKSKKYNMVIKVYNKMTGIRVFRSFLSLNVLIEFFAHFNKPGFAVGVLGTMVKCGFKVDTYCLNMVLNGFCRNGDVFRAVKIFNEWCRGSVLLPDVVTYTTLMDGLCKSGRMGEAIDLLKEMKLKGMNANVVTYGALVNGFCNSKNFDEAKKLYDTMLKEGVEPNNFIYSSLLQCLCTTGRWKESSELFNVLLDRGIKPNVITYNVLINGLCKVGRPSEALQILDLMAEKGVEANTITYNILIDGFCKSGSVTEALRVFAMMIEEGDDKKHDVFSYNTLAWGLCESGKVDMAIKLVCLMLKDENCAVADYHTLITLIYGLCKAGRLREAMKIHREMLGNLNMKEIGSFNLLISVHLKKGYVGTVMKLLKSGLESGLVLNSQSYSTMIKVFC